MSLPFTMDAFFEVIAGDNATTWPEVVAPWVAVDGAALGVARTTANINASRPTIIASRTAELSAGARDRCLYCPYDGAAPR